MRRLIFITVFAAIHILTGDCEKVEMRIVDEPTSYSWQQNSNNHNRETVLQMRVNPSPFSGPEHLRRLANKCFTKNIEKYEYQLCPFANLTQKEVGTNTWNPYNGILGVWQEWAIKDNHFTSMMMLMGDQCGVNPRQSEVKFECGKSNEIVSVREPRHCEYELIFSTPLTCHNHSMLVYPTLSNDLQTQWNQLLTEYKEEEITGQGYKKGLEKLFQSAGYKLKPVAAVPKPSDSIAAGQAALPAAQADSKVITSFTDLASCNAGYASLKQELEQTKAQLHTDT